MVEGYLEYLGDYSTAQKTVITVSLCAVVSLLAVFGIVWLLGARLSHMSYSREGGFQLKTNDRMVLNERRNEIGHIDSYTQKKMRRATMSRTILDPSVYGVTAEVMLVNYRANQPLINAVHENHHTRELADGTAEGYIIDKARDVWEAVRRWEEKIPELTYELCEAYVCSWIKNVLIRALRRASEDKIVFYTRMNRRKDVSKDIKEENEWCIRKNKEHLDRFDKLEALPIIVAAAERTSIICKE